MILLNLKCHLSVIRNTVSADYGSQTVIHMITIGSKNGLKKTQVVRNLLQLFRIMFRKKKKTQVDL